MREGGYRWPADNFNDKAPFPVTGSRVQSNEWCQMSFICCRKQMSTITLIMLRRVNRKLRSNKLLEYRHKHTHTHTHTEIQNQTQGYFCKIVFTIKFHHNKSSITLHQRQTRPILLQNKSLVRIYLLWFIYLLYNKTLYNQFSINSYCFTSEIH